MRVALVAMETTRHNDSVGNRRLERIARLLADRGHEVTLFCGQWWDDYRTEMVVDGVRHYGVTLGTATSSFCARLPALLASYRPDIIHTRPKPPQQAVAALTGSKLARAPLAVEWYGEEPITEDTRFTSWVTSKPQRVITPSELVRTWVRELGADEDNSRVIPESIDYSRIEAVEPDEDVDVVYAHRLDETANMDDLLLGLAELRERDWHATIVGDGPLREEYENEVQKLRIEDRVEFVGNCDRERRLGIYRGAHVFIQTAFREYFATELLWALACGCIGVVEYQAESSAIELIENYNRSYRVTSSQQLADAIADAGEFEHRTIDDSWEQYDHEHIIERYLDEYREMQAEFGIGR
jgi:glycosyltransferase involved in cell wall biosynthesis